MGYYVPKEKPLCYNCQFRTGNYCGILTENEGVKDFVGTYNENPRCPLVEMEEPQTGEWMFSPDDAEGICTVCQYKIYGRPYQGRYLIVPYNFCPNCGARMVTE